MCENGKSDSKETLDILTQNASDVETVLCYTFLQINKWGACEILRTDPSFLKLTVQMSLFFDWRCFKIYCKVLVSWRQLSNSKKSIFFCFLIEKMDPRSRTADNTTSEWKIEREDKCINNETGANIVMMTLFEPSFRTCRICIVWKKGILYSYHNILQIQKLNG